MVRFVQGERVVARGTRRGEDAPGHV